MPNNLSLTEKIEDYSRAMLLSGKPVYIRYKYRPENFHPLLNAIVYPRRSIPRIDIFYPLARGDTRRDVIAHECAHIAYADMTSNKLYPEIEAIRIMENIEPELIELYSTRDDIGEECVVCLADYRRAGAFLPEMSLHLSGIVRRLASPKPVLVAMWVMALTAGLSAVLGPLMTGAGML